MWIQDCVLIYGPSVKGGFQVFFRFPATSALPLPPACPAWPPAHEAPWRPCAHSAGAAGRGSVGRGAGGRGGVTSGSVGTTVPQPVSAHAPTAPSVLGSDGVSMLAGCLDHCSSCHGENCLFGKHICGRFSEEALTLFSSLSRLCSSMAQPKAGFVAVSIFPV